MLLLLGFVHHCFGLHYESLLPILSLFSLFEARLARTSCRHDRHQVASFLTQCRVYLRSERCRGPVKSRSNCCRAQSFALNIVETILTSTVARNAIETWRKAVAVKLQTLGVTTIAWLPRWVRYQWQWKLLIQMGLKALMTVSLHDRSIMVWMHTFLIKLLPLLRTSRMRILILPPQIIVLLGWRCPSVMSVICPSLLLLAFKVMKDGCSLFPLRRFSAIREKSSLASVKHVILGGHGSRLLQLAVSGVGLIFLVLEVQPLRADYWARD